MGANWKEGIEKAKEAAKAARQAKIAAARSGGGAGARGGARGGAGAGPGAGTNPETFATVGEKLVPLTGPEDVARFARTIEATRTAKSHALNDRSSRRYTFRPLPVIGATLHVWRILQ